MLKRLILLFGIFMLMTTIVRAEERQVRYKTVDANGVRVFYREAGNPDKPAILLLHGFPSASHMFRELMPELADEYHLIAPDFPSFGQTEAPSRDKFAYTFDNLAKTVDAFTEKLGLKRYAMYLFDYGAPVGFRLAMWHPERITAIVSQNGNAYEEGLGKKWEARKEYWKKPTPELRKQYASAYALDTIIGQYTFGTPENSVGPDGYTLDYAYVQMPERAEMQNDLILDYRSNVALYPEFQKYMRDHQPPLLAVWGKNDPSFIPAGAEAFKKDLPDAEIRFVNSGHFALESHHREIAALMKAFLKKYLK
ncbi:MAG: alpha/beta hydrolase [Alphaproteobacteria bacterium]|nr:alpha/beta hydrolase [Alphaproteobacteria bacterium]